MAFNNPLPADFKAQFVRDFPYSTDPNAGVTDSDIVNAFNLVNINMNGGLFGTQQGYTLGYLYLSAHFLVMNLRASSQGINGQYNWIQASKSVQGVSEGFSIPERMMSNPFFAMLTKTNYGAQFFQIVLPALTGQIFSTRGTTRA